MATYRHTGVGNAVARTDYAAAGQVQDGKLNWVDGGGTADAITATYSPAITALVDGQLCCVRATAANATTTPTFAPNGLTARTIVKVGGTAVAAGDIKADGHELLLRYDLANTRWELLNPASASLSANTFTGIQRWAKGADVASANALTLGTDGNYFDITGTTAITSIGTLKTGANDAPQVKLHFDAALTLTHHATDLILPGGANITTAAGDEAEFVEYATGDWRCTNYTKASGQAVASSITNTGETNFLAANVPLNNTATYFSGPNTGAIGAAGQTWLIIAVGCAVNTTGSTKFCLRIYDGTTAHADTESSSLSVNAAINMTAAAVVTLSGATTFTLQMKDALSTSGFILTTGANVGTANKSTSITAIRIS